jgi:hypothetical protein
MHQYICQHSNTCFAPSANTSVSQIGQRSEPASSLVSLSMRAHEVTKGAILWYRTRRHLGCAILCHFSRHEGAVLLWGSTSGVSIYCWKCPRMLYTVHRPDSSAAERCRLFLSWNCLSSTKLWASAEAYQIWLWKPLLVASSLYTTRYSLRFFLLVAG